MEPAICYRNYITTELTAYEKFKDTAPKALLLLIILGIHITITGRMF